MIELVNLSKSYRNIKAVDKINLRIEDGTIFGFLGPNGAGKTTTIKMMAGVMSPTGGRIILDGIDLMNDPVSAKKIVGYIPDRPFLYERLTGWEFLKLISALYGMNGSTELDKKILRLLNLFEIAEWKDELIESYSHGMKQRLIMCSALIHDPKILIVDEPMVGLDPKAMRLVKEIFRKKAQEGMTLFISTHSLEVAQELCNEVAIIHKGRIVARGTLDDLKRGARLDGTLEEIFLKIIEEEMND